MPLACPHCLQPISPYKLRRRVTCPSCKASLTSNFLRVLPLALLLAAVAEAALLYTLTLLVSGKLTSDTFAFGVWLCMAGVTGYVVYGACIKSCAQLGR